MYHGIINVYKEEGFTSHDVVAKLRGIAGQKKIGHTGTLDPAATGVLPVCLGAGTKLCDMLTDKSKEYIAVLQLGVITDTQDTTGTVLEEKEVTCKEEDILKAIQSFVGEYNQIPPMYSALKVNGQKLYELARQGKEIERQARRVVIDSIEIMSDYDETCHQIEMKVACSKGTYIRTLCHDIGEKLGCGGAMASLKRSRVGNFVLEEAYTLSKLQALKDEGRLADVITPVDKVFEECPAAIVNDSGLKMLKNGNILAMNQLLEKPELTDGAWCRMYDADKLFYAIYSYEQKNNLLKPEKMFLTER